MSNELKPRRWLLVVFIIIAIIIVIVLLNKLTNNNKKGFTFDIFGIFNNQIVSSFNSSYEFRAGSQQGSIVLDLLEEVVKNNKKNKDHIIDIFYKESLTNDTNEIKNIKTNIDRFNKYEITLDYDEQGYVNKITIEQIENDEENGINDIIEKAKDNPDSFNQTYEVHTGTNHKGVIGWVIDDVITNNKKNSNHIITIIFKDKSTTDPTEMLDIKKSLDKWKEYEVILDYDENGFVNKITIEE